MKVWDSFLPNFEKFEAEVRALDYTGTVNPVDNVMYPDVSAEVNPLLLEYITARCSKYLGKKVVPKTAFHRLTCASTDTAPHQAHNDEDMGQYTFLLYWQDGPGGTALVEHAGGWKYPQTDAEVKTWARDTNVYESWIEYDRVEMEANRATVFDSRIMHRAEPVQGFGECSADGRIATIVFFDTQEI